ncbi:unnamed protein product, partial [Allacma fusca]
MYIVNAPFSLHINLICIILYSSSVLLFSKLDINVPQRPTSHNPLQLSVLSPLPSEPLKTRALKTNVGHSYLSSSLNVDETGEKLRTRLPLEGSASVDLTTTERMYIHTGGKCNSMVWKNAQLPILALTTALLGEESGDAQVQGLNCQEKVWELKSCQ